MSIINAPLPSGFSGSINQQPLDYTLAASDEIVEFTNGSQDRELTFPLNATVPIAVGRRFLLRKAPGLGDITFIKEDGAQVFRGVFGDADSTYKIFGEDGYNVSVQKTDTDTWLFDGALKQ